MAQGVTIIIRDDLSDADWDEQVWRQPLGNVFCSSMWGRYKARLGWRVGRLATLTADGDLLGLVQYHSKQKGPIRFTYIQGGPLLTGRGEREAPAIMTALIEKLAPRSLDFLGINFQSFTQNTAVLALLSRKFVPVLSPRNFTLELDIRGDEAAIMSGMAPRFRKPLRQALANPRLSHRFVTDREERLTCFDAFAVMYEELKARKGFGGAFDSSAYRDLLAADPHHLLLEIREGGELILVRIAHLSAQRCTDFFVASNERARASAAANLSVWRIIQQARASGCHVFDFGGIDPDGNPGVTAFKTALSQKVALAGPLWLYGRSPTLRTAAAAFLAHR
ncbi:GNAT family N-acetyltransferase [Methylobacterium sp. AMS5]|uniref:lipid II:glycine glycyltransferase FemX n=1 Tax=Methylobacterium sp. AMS5 TaxID=925818 RepID=UPI00074FA219|nr:GNAT family N-acetyltransferase [Methylobacterium sp. AMS5]AMB44410.1 hypothetical protein Y590_05835 [Methylobacterium sp. AMS5]